MSYLSKCSSHLTYNLVVSTMYSNVYVSTVFTRSSENLANRSACHQSNTENNKQVIKYYEVYDYLKLIDPK
jgi:hypothetical protein